MPVASCQGSAIRSCYEVHSLLLALVLPVFPCIGESKEQLSSRYGVPTETQENSRVYCKSGYVMKVLMIDDQCHWIRFAKDPEGEIEGPLPSGQPSGLFTSNQDDLKWTLAADGTFRSSDEQPQAIVADGRCQGGVRRGRP